MKKYYVIMEKETDNYFVSLDNEDRYDTTTYLNETDIYNSNVRAVRRLMELGLDNFEVCTIDINPYTELINEI